MAAAHRLRAACKTGDMAKVQELLHLTGPATAATAAMSELERHRLVNAANARGVGPLMFAVRYDHPQIVRLLLACGADLYQQTRLGAAAIHLACYYGA